MPPPRLAWRSLLLCALLGAVSGQSTCHFMHQTNFILDTMPDEPFRNPNLTVCTVSKSTCCTTAMEQQMQMTSRLAMERSIQDQIILVRQQLQDFSATLRVHFLEALNETRSNLHGMFERSYGDFYLKNRRIFDDFFDELEAHFLSSAPASTPGVKQALNRLFRRLFVKIFEIMNPLRPVGEFELGCLAEVQDEVRPFGALPHKIALHLERSFAAWRAVLRSIDDANDTLYQLLDVVIAPDCVRALTRMQECHVCSGATSYTRPCSGFCLNVLKGCFAEFAEIDPQWNSLIESLLLFTDRLGGAYNPLHMLAPVPTQVSEAIMNFQEKGMSISNRVILHCFHPRHPGAKDVVVADLGAKKLDEKENELPVVASDAHGYHYRARRRVTQVDVEKDSYADDSDDHDDDDDDCSDESPLPAEDAVQETLGLFVDRLILMKNFWRSLPSTVCSEKQVAAPRGEICWTGYRMGRYVRRVVGDGVASQSRNPEFDTGLPLSKDAYLDERIQLAVIARRLEAHYRSGKPYDSYEASGMAAGDVIIQGSGLPAVDDDDAFNANLGIPLESLEYSEDDNYALPVSGASRIRLPVFFAAGLCLLLRLIIQY